MILNEEEDAEGRKVANSVQVKVSKHNVFSFSLIFSIHCVNTI
jgi:hypothetical protein